MTEPSATVSMSFLERYWTNFSCLACDVLCICFLGVTILIPHTLGRRRSVWIDPRYLVLWICLLGMTMLMLSFSFTGPFFNVLSTILMILTLAKYLCGCRWALFRYRRSSFQHEPWRKSSMMIGFQKSVEEVAKQVRRSMMMEELVVPVANQQNRRHPTTTVGPCPAISGRYRCIIHVQQIYQFQKAILPVVAPTTSSIDLIFTRDEEDQSGLGWDIHGSHQMDSSASPVLSGGEWRLEEGHLSPTGEAYWVEKDPSGTNLLLVHGTFHTHGPSSPCHTAFQGEWLTSNGDRGRFSDVVHEPELESSSHSQLKQQEEVYPGTPSKEVFIAVPVPNIPNMRTTVNGR